MIESFIARREQALGQQSATEAKVLSLGRLKGDASKELIKSCTALYVLLAYSKERVLGCYVSDRQPSRSSSGPR
jgi:hypothetical protein